MNLKKHSAALAVITTWVGGFLVLSRHQPDFHEAISQYSVHGNTWIPFGITLTIASFFLAIFGSQLSSYWQPAKWLMRISAALLIITAWTPYGSSTLPHWLHVVSFISSVFAITLVLWRTTISFYPRLSNALLLAFIVSAGAAAGAVLVKKWSFHLELTMLAIAQIWLILLAYTPDMIAVLRKVTNQEPAQLG